MIVRDFNWRIFNISKDFSLVFFWLKAFYSIHSLLSQKSFLEQSRKDYVDIKILFWLGAEYNMFAVFSSYFFLTFNSIMLGNLLTSSEEFDDSLVDITGKVFFDDEIFLFDSEHACS